MLLGWVVVGLLGLASAVPARSSLSSRLKRPHSTQRHESGSHKIQERSHTTREASHKTSLASLRADALNVDPSSSGIQPTTTASTATPTEIDACGSIGMFTSTATPGSDGQVAIPASMAYDCLNSIPFDKAAANRLLDSVALFLEWQTTFEWVKQPPAEYAQKVQVPYDFHAAFDSLKSNVSAGAFKSLYEFEKTLYSTVQRVHDGHLAYIPVTLLLFQFGRPAELALVSVSADGKGLPQVFVNADIIATELLGAVFTPSPVKQINGDDVEKFLSDLANQFTLTDKDAQWNSLMYSNAQQALGAVGIGRGYFTGGNIAATLYPGPSTELVFANGTSLNATNFAIPATHVNFTDIINGPELWQEILDTVYTTDQGLLSTTKAATTTATAVAPATSKASSNPLDPLTSLNLIPGVDPGKAPARSTSSPTAAAAGGQGGATAVAGGPSTSRASSVATAGGGGGGGGGGGSVGDGEATVGGGGGGGDVVTTTAAPKNQANTPTTTSPLHPITPTTNTQVKNGTFVHSRAARDRRLVNLPSASAILTSPTVVTAAAAAATTTLAAAAAAAESPTRTPRPGYPVPNIVNPENNENSGYLLSGNGYDDVAVLALNTFQQDGTTENFANTNRQLIEQAQKQGKKKLIIDMSANAGGLTFQAFDLFKLLFPNESTTPLSRWRAQEALNLMGEQTASLLKQNSNNWTHELSDQYNIRVNEEEVWDYTADLDKDNKPFPSWEAKFGPFPSGPGPDNFTALLRFNLSDPLTTEQDGNVTVGFNKSRTSLISGRPFEPENIVLLYDGFCASACAIFSEMMRTFPEVRSVVVGGRPNQNPMQGVGGTKGAEAVMFTEISDDIKGVISLSPASLSQKWSGTIISKYTDGALQGGTAHTSLNVADMIGNEDTDEVPLQFQYRAADCRLFYTTDMVISQLSVWQTVADAAWNGRDICVSGNLTSSATPTVPSQTVSSETSGIPDNTVLQNNNNNQTALSGLKVLAATPQPSNVPNSGSSGNSTSMRSDINVQDILDALIWQPRPLRGRRDGCMVI